MYLQVDLNVKWPEMLSLRFFYAHLLNDNDCQFCSRAMDMNNGYTQGDCGEEGQPLLLDQRWDASCFLSLCTHKFSPKISAAFQFPVFIIPVTLDVSLMFRQLSRVTLWTALTTQSQICRVSLNFRKCLTSRSEHKPFLCRGSCISCYFCLQSCCPRFWHDRWSCSFGEQARLWPRPGQQVLYRTSK